MGAAPEWVASGMVTFLLTDVQGSTKLWETEPDAMAVALPRHDAIFSEVVESHDGWLVKSKGEGDSVFVVFASPSAAVAAAVEIQRVLLAERWPTTRSLSVRMSIHTGEAELRDGDWYGPTVNRAARIRATAHGGQVVISESSRCLIGDDLPPECTLRDLGERRLKDLTEPERIWQLEHPVLPSSFPPLVALDARPHNLPIQPTPFIGREEDVVALRDRLRDSSVRLVTLTGTGGVGKTRLALQAAAECIDDFEHGVWFVALAAVSEERLVALAIANALGVKDDGRPTVEAVTDHVADKRLLLVLDNFEHLLDEATLVADLLSAAPGLKVLATSREWLHLRAEHEVPLQPLPTAPAVELFGDRAAAVAPGFHVDASTEADVRAICDALDGLPLAIELVAARVRRFSVTELRSDLVRPLDVATDGARDLPARQRTLRDTIAWSYQLLDDAEREVLCRLSVFVGGARVSALTAVCDGDPEVTRLIESLADKSLVRTEAGAGDDNRVTVLESVRQFALEALEAEGMVAQTASAHADWHAELAAVGDGKLTGPEQGEWLARLEEEHGNLRAAIDWLRAEPDRAQRLGGHLGRFWEVRGHFTEGRRWYRGLLELGGTDPVARGSCLVGAGNLAEKQGDEPDAERLLREGLAVFESIDHRSGMAQCHNKLGDLARRRQRVDEAEGHYATARVLFEQTHAAREVALVMTKQGIVRNDAGDAEAAAALWQEALRRAQAAGDGLTAASVGNNLGLLSLRAGDFEAASAQFRAAAGIWREMGARDLLMSLALPNQAIAARKAGRHDEAMAAFLEMAAVASELGDAPRRRLGLYNGWRSGMALGEVPDRPLVEDLQQSSLAAGDDRHAVGAAYLLVDLAVRQGDQLLIRTSVGNALAVGHRLGVASMIAQCLANLGELAVDDAEFGRAARLFGATDRLVAGTSDGSHAAHVAVARTTLGEAAYEAAHAEGGGWSVDEAVAYALGS